MKKLSDTATLPKQVRGENGDIQFNTTGSGILDLVSNGADIFIQKDQPLVVQRYVKLCENAASEDLELTVKIGRYFRDREKGQGLKEQPLLMIAALDGKLSVEQILSILAVFNEKKPGSVDLKTVDLSDIVKILAWHKYVHGKKANLSYELCIAFAKIISEHKNPLTEVLRLKNREVGINEKNTKQVSIIDIIGIVKGFRTPKLPEDVAKEYKVHLYPRHRGGEYYHIGTGTKVAQEWRDYFNGDLEAGYIPEGITFDKVLCTGRIPDITKMIEDGRISTAQLKVNMQKLSTIVGNEKIATLLSKRNMTMFPHELYAMAKAFSVGTLYTKADVSKLTTVDALFQNLLKKYKTDCKQNVVVLGDTSGSMGIPLSKKSSIYAAEFSAFMSYFASLVCGHGVFGIWDDDARLYQATTTSIKDFMKLGNIPSTASTDVYKAITSTADYFARKKIEAPEFVCLISDMQFNAVPSYRYGAQKSQSVTAALEYYEKKTGVEAQLIFWNVADPTSACTQDATGVMCISGFSAANANLMFGIVDQTEGKLSPDDVVKHVKAYYND